MDKRFFIFLWRCDKYSRISNFCTVISIYSVRFFIFLHFYKISPCERESMGCNLTPWSIPRGYLLFHNRFPTRWRQIKQVAAQDRRRSKGRQNRPDKRLYHHQMCLKYKNKIIIQKFCKQNSPISDFLKTCTKHSTRHQEGAIFRCFTFPIGNNLFWSQNNTIFRQNKWILFFFLILTDSFKSTSWSWSATFPLSVYPQPAVQQRVPGLGCSPISQKSFKIWWKRSEVRISVL